MFGVFEEISLILVDINLSFQVLLQLNNKIVLLLDNVNLLLFVVLKCYELLVKIPFQFKDDLSDQLDLRPFALICVQLETVIQ